MAWGSSARTSHPLKHCLCEHRSLDKLHLLPACPAPRLPLLLQKMLQNVCSEASCKRALMSAPGMHLMEGQAAALCGLGSLAHLAAACSTAEQLLEHTDATPTQARKWQEFWE